MLSSSNNLGEGASVNLQDHVWGGVSERAILRTGKFSDPITLSYSHITWSGLARNDKMESSYGLNICKIMGRTQLQCQSGGNHEMSATDTLVQGCSLV